MTSWNELELLLIFPGTKCHHISNLLIHQKKDANRWQTAHQTGRFHSCILHFCTTGNFIINLSFRQVLCQTWTAAERWTYFSVQPNNLLLTRKLSVINYKSLVRYPHRASLSNAVPIELRDCDKWRSDISYTNHWPTTEYSLLLMKGYI